MLESRLLLGASNSGVRHRGLVSGDECMALDFSMAAWIMDICRGFLKRRIDVVELEIYLGDGGDLRITALSLIDQYFYHKL